MDNYHASYKKNFLNMKLYNYIPITLIGFSYSLLLINKIYFGISIILGTILLMISRKPFKINLNFKIKIVDYFFYSTLFFFFLTSFNSIQAGRSFSVIIYFYCFIFLGLNLFFFFKEKPQLFNKLILFLVISTTLNITIIFIYNFLSYDFDNLEVKKFKGILNVITFLVISLPFFMKKKILYLPVLILIPSLLYSNSNAPFLGVFCGIFFCFILFLSLKLNISKKNIGAFFILASVFVAYKIFEYLPNKFDEKSIQTQKFTISEKIIDAHRQFIWGFSLSKVLEKPFAGHGPDSSNFIDGSQKKINHELTGTMPFIPSHPHNFLIELLLDTGILGTLLFSLLILFINLEIFKRANTYQKYFLIFFNGYFWGSSLVNFSFWLGWWQGSYFFLLSLIAIKIYLDKTIKSN